MMKTHGPCADGIHLTNEPSITELRETEAVYTQH